MNSTTKKKRARTATSSDLLPVGRVAGVFGLQGELKCDPTSAGRTVFCAGSNLGCDLADGTQRAVEIAAVREHKGRLLIRLQGVTTANDAQVFVGAQFTAERDRLEVNEGEYLDRDLIGCVLVDPHGRELGSVSRVDHYPSSDMLVVHGRLVPMIRQFITNVDLGARRIVTDLPPGLLDDDAVIDSAE